MAVGPLNGIYQRNESDDGWMPSCPTCKEPYLDAEIGEVKNYPDDGQIAVFFTCAKCKDESYFCYEPSKEDVPE